MTQIPEPSPEAASDDALDGAKRRQILDGARAVFLERGFDAASMNDITRAAGVSKATVYAYFPSKEALFAALVTCDKREQAERLQQLDDDRRDPRDVLEELGLRLLEEIVCGHGVARARMVIAVTPRHPEIGRAFYEAGFQTGMTRLGAYLLRQAQLGRLSLSPAQAEAEAAAGQFLDLCVAGTIRRLMFGVDGDVPAERRATVVRAAVEMFFRAYGPPARVLR